jgi:hypothetical protein
LPDLVEKKLLLSRASAASEAWANSFQPLHHRSIGRNACQAAQAGKQQIVRQVA